MELTQDEKDLISFVLKMESYKLGKAQVRIVAKGGDIKAAEILEKNIQVIENILLKLGD